MEARNPARRWVAARSRRTWPGGSLLTLTVLALLLPSSVARAKDEPNRIERWRQEIAEIDGELRDGEPRSTKRARRDAEKLWVEVRQRGWREPALDRVLADLATLLSVAELNLGEDRDLAVWRYHAALLLDPAVAERDWAPYGRAGKVLSEVEPRVLGASPPGRRVLRRPFPRGGRFERPSEGAVKEVEVPLNRGARHDGRMERPTIEVVLHDDGKVSHPAIALGHSAKPTVLLGVLDMIWAMTPYVPARLDGEPVEVLYEISVDTFKFDRWDEMVVYH